MTDTFDDDTAETDTAVTGLLILADLRRDLHARGLQAAVAVVDEHAAATIALLAPGMALTVDGGHYVLRTADPAASSAAAAADPAVGFVSYHGDFEAAFRRSDGDETRPELDAPRARLWDLIAATPALTWMLLTKRPEHVTGMVPWAPGGWPAHVWLGVTAESQSTADQRVPILLATGARTRFLSCEPLAGPLDLTAYLTGPPAAVCTRTRGRGGLTTADRRAVAAFGQQLRRAAGGPGIDWIITGGESGPKATPSQPDWFRGIRDLALDHGVAYFHKQWGEHDAHGRRVGKKAAGALLDGVLWRQIPDNLPTTTTDHAGQEEQPSCSTRTR